MESYTLYQLNEYIRRVIALNFREPIWIEAEIMQCRSSKGHCYIELIQKEDISDTVLAQSTAVIWYKSLQFIRRKVGDVLDDILQDGTEVRVKCRVDFSERYGLKLIIEDVDPKFTYGQLELNRQNIIQRLQNEGLIELNKGLIMPDVVQRLAVISSANAAGYKDFVNQLKNNSYGYTYHLDLYDCAVQGINVEQDTIDATEKIVTQKEKYDSVIILRGGGSKLDLSAYDNYKIAKAIAHSGIPFIIGIGHDIDSTVADLVSCISVKTPTAAADFLIERCLHYESEMEHSFTLIRQLSSNAISEAYLSTERYAQRLELLATKLLQLKDKQLSYSFQELNSVKLRLIEKEQLRLKHITHTLQHLDPQLVLARGYAYVTHEGQRPLLDQDQVSQGELINVHLHKGSIKATVE